MDKAGDKFRQMEDEMSRFEAEISGRSLAGNTFTSFSLPGFGNIPPPPTPPMMIPQQVRTPNAVVSAKPALYAIKPSIQVPQQPPPQQQQQQQQPATSNSLDIVAIKSEVERKLKALKEKVSVPAELAISQGKASSALQAFGPEDYRRRTGPRNKKLLRTAGGTTWEDLSLTDWAEDDFRIFCGDLGNDVTDELLTRTFNKFPSFQRARVVRDKRTNKSKGYGFISFKDPADFTKAMKEMNGRYVGSRPIKLRKSCWKNRCVDVVRKKEKEKAVLISMLTGNNR